MQHCLGIEYANDKLWIADTYNHKIKLVNRVTGDCQSVFEKIAFSEPSGLSYLDGYLYIADTNNHTIRKINLSSSSVETIEFTGQVNITEYLGKIDIIVLTSISEAQPLVVLEAGAAGIPAIVTNVGSCPEIINGTNTELPNLGKAGEICQLASPKAIADAAVKLFSDKEYYQQCSATIKERVRLYYNKETLSKQYRDLYEQLITEKDLQ